ncbi:MAG: DUF1015 domain-containing protein [Deltaproteobacteria bacterium]|nr:DUF1015 domain-containing protein [Deltaproteobacteria bacterium]
MAVIAPFRGLTYNVDRLGDISRLVAPPYDVISEEEQEEYYQTDPYNIIRLILGKTKIGDSDWDNRYTRAADLFQRWESEDAFIRDEFPSMYLTSLTYDPEDGRGPRVRWGVIVVVKIEEEDSGVILPHERTFSAHREDRLKLMRTCNAQFSQIFSLFEDPHGDLLHTFEGISQTPPHFSFPFMDGTGHEMWIVQEPEILEKAARVMAEKRIFIADGHHRYETSRNYRNIMRARYGKRPHNRSYEYVVMYLTSMDDPGLTILPSHRLVKRCPDFDLDIFMGKVKKWFDITTIPSGKGDGTLRKSLDEEQGRATSAIGFHHHGLAQDYLLTLKPETRDQMGDDLAPPLRELDVLVLSRFILQSALGFTRADLDNEEIFHYQSDFPRAMAVVDSGDCQMAFLLNPTRIEQVKEVAGSGLIMPRKSTYFYPKILTGLVFNKIVPNETIEFPTS